MNGNLWLPLIVNTIPADVLATQGAMASAAMELIYLINFSWNITVSAQHQANTLVINGNLTMKGKLHMYDIYQPINVL